MRDGLRISGLVTLGLHLSALTIAILEHSQEGRNLSVGYLVFLSDMVVFKRLTMTRQ